MGNIKGWWLGRMGQNRRCILGSPGGLRSDVLGYLESPIETNTLEGGS